MVVKTYRDQTSTQTYARAGRTRTNGPILNRVATRRILPGQWPRGLVDEPAPSLHKMLEPGEPTEDWRKSAVHIDFWRKPVRSISAVPRNQAGHPARNNAVRWPQRGSTRQERRRRRRQLFPNDET